MNEEDPVRQTAAALGEKEHGPIAQIRRIFERCERDHVEAWLARTREIEAQGGMLTNNGKRRRTPGGVFFHLVRGDITDTALRNYIFDPPDKPKPYKKKRKKASPAAAEPGERWEDRSAWIAAADVGRATTVKVTIIGRPAGKPVVREGFTLLRFAHTPRLDSMPKGLPVPAKAPETPYVVYVAAKQWRRVAEAIQNPEDLLICEGVQTWDAHHQAITVFASSCTTKLIQQGQKAAQRAAEGG